MTNERDTWVSRTALSGHAGALRLSLFAALGLSSYACGGTAVSASDGGGGTVSEGGATGRGGSEMGVPHGGSSPGGGSFGGRNSAGAAGSEDHLCLSSSYDPVTHLSTCNGGLVHRAQASACAVQYSEGGAGGESSADAGAGGDSGCTSNADCASLPYGWCESWFPNPARCVAGCRVDSDCGTGSVCQCDPRTVAGRCVQAGCQVDADCGNSFCTQVQRTCDYPTFQCSDGENECTPGDNRCKTGICGLNNEGRYVCSVGVCGRPFLISDSPRQAAVIPRSDWLDASIGPQLAGLSALQRAELAAHWARLGQMEHASIAAFARFNLQLLSLGAPGDLIEACNRALVDETAHTRLCFALASQYAGSTLGPGKLEVRDCFEDVSLSAVMRLVLREGCIGETVAALEALDGATHATDPVVEGVLRRIARDEQAHAELAFRFMRWALSQASSDERAEIALEAEGRLTAFEQDAHSHVQRIAARDVVRPLVSALFAQREPRHAADFGAVATTE